MTNVVTHRARTRIRMLTAAAVALALVSVGAVSGATHEAAAAGSQVTYQAVGTQPGSLSAGFTATSGADGWALAVSSTQLFNVSHHSSTLVVACHNQNDASSCWNGTKTVTGPAGVNYITPVGAGLWLNQTTGHMYTYVVRASDSTAGVECIDTSKPASATGAQLDCGFTALSGVGEAPIVVNSGISSPVQVGTNWYAFNAVAGTSSGTENKLLCFNLAVPGPCASQPFAVSYGGLTLAAIDTSPPIGAAGSRVFVQVAGTTGNRLACFDTNALPGGSCGGSWPLTVSAIAGAPFPLLDTSGTATATGICMPVAGIPCYTLAGAAVGPLPGMAAAIAPNDRSNGPAAVVNNSVYVPSEISGTVGCYNYTTQTNCANFPKQLNIFLLYTVNTDPQRPTCLWVNSDSRSGQIQNFDTSTGLPCSQGFVRILASSMVNPAPACQPTAYSSLQLTSPTRSSYGSATVSFQDAQGNPLNIPSQPIDSFGSVNLDGLRLAAASSDPMFVIRFDGMTQSPANFWYRLTWAGAASAACTSQGQSVSSVPGYWMVASDGGIFNYGNAGFYGSAGAVPLNKPIVGIAALQNKGGYWLVASDGGIFNYGYANFYGSTGAITLNKPIVGMAATPSGKGYWLVASDGGIFAYGDAAFYGSTGAINLNKPIVGMATTSDGGGYWLVASDGGIFAFGDAAFYGSAGATALNKPIVGIAANPNGGGYWMVASDGGIFSYGNVGFFGSTGAIKLNKPIVGMAATFDAKGYWLVASDGGIFSYGDAVFEGSAGALPLNKPIVSLAS